jgi:hypothetical protein
MKYWQKYRVTRLEFEASTTPMAAPEGNYAVFLSYFGISYRIYSFLYFFVIILLRKSCTLVHNFTHYAPLLCTMQISGLSVLLLYYNGRIFVINIAIHMVIKAKIILFS